MSESPHLSLLLAWSELWFLCQRLRTESLSDASNQHLSIIDWVIVSHNMAMLWNKKYWGDKIHITEDILLCLSVSVDIAILGKDVKTLSKAFVLHWSCLRGPVCDWTLRSSCCQLRPINLIAHLESEMWLVVGSSPYCNPLLWSIGQKCHTYDVCVHLLRVSEPAFFFQHSVSSRLKHRFAHPEITVLIQRAMKTAK